LGNILEDKIQLSYKKNNRILPTAPRTLTQAQIYTINEIMKNKEKNTSYRGKAPTASDTFALLPMKHTGMKTGEMYVDFSGSLQDNKRIYFGPVDIDRIHIKLLDDRSYVVDLHGSEWCITLISENLYQY
jgi:regulatory protein YycH of two-component signal transduction system YycFG